MYTYHNFGAGWYLQLNDDWGPRITVSNVGNQYEFYLWDEGYKTTQKFMTLYMLSGQNREEQGLSEERFILHKTDSVVYAAQLESCARDLGLTEEIVVYSFRLIQQDWKTGET